MSLIGKSIGRYHITGQLGEGGMATVYKAFDTRLERDIAIKIIRRGAFPSDHIERILKRFEREAKALARLSHTNIVKVLDYGEFEGAPYLVLEYLPAGTLKHYLGEPMPWEEAIQLLLPIARALDYAHQRGFVHRDIKPANILITEDGEPMLSDFGIAKILTAEEAQTLTGTGVGIGTPEYMAPEQGMGQDTDARADIYSLGIVLYELITGQKPYQADTPMAVVLKQMTDPLPRPGILVPDLPESIEKVIFKCLAKQPDDRYLDMGSLIEVFMSLITGMATESPLSERTKKISKQIKIAVADLTRDDSDISQPVTRKSKRQGGDSERRSLPIWSVVLMGALILTIIVLLGINQGWGSQIPGVAHIGELLQGQRNSPTPTLPSTPTTWQPTEVSSTFTATVVRPTATVSIVSQTPTPPQDSSEEPILSLLFDEDFEDGKADHMSPFTGNWEVVHDGTGNYVLESREVTDNKWAHIEFGPSGLASGVIEYQVKLLKYDSLYDSGGKTSLQFWAEQWGDSNYSVDIEPYSRKINLAHNGAYPGGDWTPLGQYSHRWESDAWHVVRVEIDAERIEVFLDGDLIITGRNDRLEPTGYLAFNVDAKAQVQFDNIRVWKSTKVADLEGVWSGEDSSIVITNTNTFEYSRQMFAEFFTPCEIGSVCGSFSIPDLPCSGNLVYIGSEGGVFQFMGQDTQGENCIEGEINEFELLPDGSLRSYFHYKSDEVEVTNNGILQKVDN